ncbi:hypothetical protein [Herbaspirillum sp. SJZ107]|uniref:hypothetical protein n=1 Tax=Herbaspirillum sp. SJZ107 TaxID=2572881 RepID=UPI0011549E37|nr:hypothetical protein [Herbaspirillum sp. SJZ107]TQK04990.1 hypothetical protein FBX97_3954 [Herbaspirillum sp. SJZ107]
MVNPIKIWNRAVPNMVGTVSCLVRWRNQYAVLGVAHVLTPTCLGTSPSARPIVECGVSPVSEIGVIGNWNLAVSNNGMPRDSSTDAAVATIDSDTAAKLVRQQDFLPSGIRRTPLTADEPLFFTGAASGTSHTTVLHDANAQAPFGYFVYELGKVRPARTVNVMLHGLIQTDRRNAVRGDSGSLLRDERGQAIGILVGMDRDETYCYFSPLGPILGDFAAELVTQDDPLSKQMRVA